MSAEVEFREMALGELIDSIAMGPFGSDLKVDNFISSGVPVLRGGNLYGFAVDDTETPFVTQQKADSLARSKALPGDLVATHRGTIGQVSIVPRKSRFPEYLVSQSQLKITLKESRVVPEYLTYWFRSNQGQFQLLSYANQTGVPAIAQPTKSFKSMRVRLPGLPVQNAVVEVLGALDDKIAANLSAVRGGRDLILAHATRILSADGEESQFGEMVEISPKIPTRSGQEVPFLDMKNLPEHGLLPSMWTTRESAGGSRFQVGDTLMARITPCFENGKIAWVDQVPFGEVGYGSTEFIVMRARAGMPRLLPYAIAVRDDFRSFAAKRMVGTSGRQRVQAAELNAYPVTAPAAAGLAQFGDASEAIVGRLSSAQKENRTLAATRDELLPLLMSGRITVKDAGRRVEQEV